MSVPTFVPTIEEERKERRKEAAFPAGIKKKKDYVGTFKKKSDIIIYYYYCNSTPVLAVLTPQIFCIIHLRCKLLTMHSLWSCCHRFNLCSY